MRENVVKKNTRYNDVGRQSLDSKPRLLGNAGMNGVALKILRRVNSRGQIQLDEALKIGKSKNGTHLDQYPLTLLIEEEYVGVTLSYKHPEGTEKLREYSRSISFHALTLPENENGEVVYNGITHSGSIDAAKETVFLKAKGALYLEELSSKRWDRILGIVIGIVVGVVVGSFTAWFATTLY